MTTKPRLRRADSFLGIHFDFHAGDDCHEIGQRVTPAMIARIIKLVRPDYLQCDNKGHRGLSSYPTKVGHRAPGFVRDQLRIWRDVTAQHGVALFVHHSGVWDTEAVTRHPAWARRDEKGKPDKKATSLFGPYADKLLIPQLKELSDVYGVDGAWVDGDCWAAQVDYGARVRQLFGKPVGKPGDPRHHAFAEFNREAFRRYLRHYVDELHRHNPNFQIASNWAFSSLMPEPVTANVDFLSGDFSMQDSVNAARWEGRCLQLQGKPWDLMAWGFAGRWEDKCRSTKSAPQLQREAAVVLALGGGFQVYYTQHRDASVAEWQMNVMAEVARFCRSRQRMSHRATPVPQVGLLLHNAAHYRRTKNLFAPWTGEYVAARGTLQCLLDNQQSVTVLQDHHLPGQLNRYPLLVWPEWADAKSAYRRQLLAYVRAGGNLLVIGAHAAKLFEKELRIVRRSKPVEKPVWLEHDGVLGGCGGAFQPVRLRPGAEPVGRLFSQNDPVGPAHVAASIARYGRGKIAGLYVNVGHRYQTAATPTARQFLGELVRRLFPRPLVEVTGSHAVDVCVNQINGKLAIHLVNTAGPHADTNVYIHDEIPPIGPLCLSIQSAHRPRAVTLAPHGTPLPFTYSNGKIRLVLPRLEIHSIVVVTGQKSAAT